MGSIIASAFRDVSRDVRDMRHAEYMLCGGRGSTKSSFISISNTSNINLSRFYNWYVRIIFIK